MLQLVSIGASVTNTRTIFLFLSVVVSTCAVSGTLFRLYKPTRRDHINKRISKALRFSYHLVELWLRLVTFVGMFILLDGYGFIFLAASMAVRFMLIWTGVEGDADSDSDWFAGVVEVFLLTASECVLEGETFDSSLKLAADSNAYLLAHMATVVEFVISAVAPMALGGVTHWLLVYLGVGCCVIKLVLLWDRRGAVFAVESRHGLNSLFVDMEKVAIVHINALKSIQCGCCCGEKKGEATDKDLELGGDNHA